MNLLRLLSRRSERAPKPQPGASAVPGISGGVWSLICSEERLVLSTSIPLLARPGRRSVRRPITNSDVPGSGPVAGRITGVAVNPFNTGTMYVATAGGGVWKTVNGGKNWNPLTDNQPTLTMGAIALAPSNPNVIYAGTGDANNASDSYYGRGVLKSTNSGDRGAC